MQPSVELWNTGPRDGLQNEKEAIPTELKIELVNRLTDAGFTNTEAASFVSTNCNGLCSKS